MKTKEELTQLKEEYESLSNKLKELTEDELKEVTAGSMPEIKKNEDYVMSTFPFIPPTPIKPIYSKNCQYKSSCAYSSKEQCPYYFDEIGDCDK